MAARKEKKAPRSHLVVNHQIAAVPDDPRHPITPMTSMCGPQRRDLDRLHRRMDEHRCSDGTAWPSSSRPNDFTIRIPANVSLGVEAMSPMRSCPRVAQARNFFPSGHRNDRQGHHDHGHHRQLPVLI